MRLHAKPAKEKTAGLVRLGMGWMLMLSMALVPGNRALYAPDGAEALLKLLGGAAAPPIAAALWHAAGASVPFLFAAASVLVAALVILIGRGALSRIDAHEADAAEEAAAVLVGDAA